MEERFLICFVCKALRKNSFQAQKINKMKNVIKNNKQMREREREGNNLL